MSRDIDPTVRRVIAKLVGRSEAGKLKYGTDLTRSDYGRREWLEELQGELLDGANYCQAEMDREDAPGSPQPAAGVRAKAEELADEVRAEIELGGHHLVDILEAALSPVAPQAGTGETECRHLNQARCISGPLSGVQQCLDCQKTLAHPAPAAPADGERVAVMLPREVYEWFLRRMWQAIALGPEADEHFMAVTDACRAALSKEDGSRE